MNIQTLTTTWNKLQHRDAAEWLTASQTREDKKQQLHAEHVLETNEVPARVMRSSQHVVFTHADLGHNPEEKSKIEELYSDLHRIGLAPRLAIG